MQITSESADGGVKYTLTSYVKYNLTAPFPHMIVDGVHIPVQIINQDLIKIGNKLIHRSALEEGGWHEYDLAKLIDGSP